MLETVHYIMTHVELQRILGMMDPTGVLSFCSVGYGLKFNVWFVYRHGENMIKMLIISKWQIPYTNQVQI